MTSDIAVHIVDYGLGNLGSIVNMFRRIGVKAHLTAHIDEISKADRILIPGVGAFDQGMRNLRDRGLIDILNQKALIEKTPVLGICLGMQLMTEGSAEGTEPGLGWIRGKTVEMRPFATAQDDLKFPHIGWNYADPQRDHYLCHDLPEDPRFYFVHSYMVQCADDQDILATTDYGSITFTSMFAKNHLAGAQCHPEKSHKFGMQLLKNFSNWMPNHE